MNRPLPNAGRRPAPAQRRDYQNVSDPISALGEAFEEMSAAVGQRIDAMEASIEPIHRYLDQPVPAASRSAGVRPLGRDGQMRIDGNAADDLGGDLVAAEHAALGNFLSTGDLDAFDEFNDQMQASTGMSVGSNASGGYTVVPQMSTAIRERLYDVSPLVRLARKVEITSGDAFQEPVETGDLDAEWVGEISDRDGQKTPDLALLTVPLNEIFTIQPVTQKLLDTTSMAGLGSWVEGRIGNKFARKEGNAFIWGNGVEQPLGLLKSEMALTDDDVRPWYVIQNKYTAGATPTADELITFVYTLRAPYRKNARWLMNLKTAGVIRKMKDGEDRYVWQESLSEGQPPLLLGFPVEFDEEMPDIATGEHSIAFGDFAQAYIIVDMPGVKMIHDPYTKKPYVLFYAYRRVGGAVQNGEAVKILTGGPA